VTELVTRLVAQGHTVACAESLTGGLVVARLVDTPGASAVVRGGIVAYATDLKASLLEVDAQLLHERGAVDADVASQMAMGVRRVMGADWGVATTGVAGPDPQDGMPVGCVFVAVAGPSPEDAADGGVVRARRHDLTGGRAAIREGAVDAALELLSLCLTDATEGSEGVSR
jgi:nicotinamide-nucleotide amidase